MAESIPGFLKIEANSIDIAFHVNERRQMHASYWLLFFSLISSRLGSRLLSYPWAIDPGGAVLTDSTGSGGLGGTWPSEKEARSDLQIQYPERSLRVTALLKLKRTNYQIRFKHTQKQSHAPCSQDKDTRWNTVCIGIHTQVHTLVLARRIRDGSRSGHSRYTVRTNPRRNWMI